MNVSELAKELNLAVSPVEKASAAILLAVMFDL